MNNISLETSSFSEQLGLYDFFNVLISGTVFTFSMISLSEKIEETLLQNDIVLTWIGVVLVIYISGLVLQEISSMLDYHFLKIKHFTRSTFLIDLTEPNPIRKIKYWFAEVRVSLIEIFGLKKRMKRSYDRIFKKRQEYKCNWVINNENLLLHYRILAKQIYTEYFPNKKFNDTLYNDEKFNSFVFSVIQYRVSCTGKDKKVEKLRALYSLARTLMFCYIILFAFIFAFKLRNLKEWLDFSENTFTITFAIFCIGLTILFFFRTKKCIKYMALILLGNYDAIQKYI